VSLCDVGSALRQFGLEPCPHILLVLLLFLEEQPNGFLCAELSDSGEVLHTETIKNLGAS
jgi:hypothetical protein